MTAELRKAIRLHVDKGVAVLRYSGCPPFACPLQDLSDSGCQCEVSLDSIDAETARQWTALLKPGLRLSVNITRPPAFVSFELMGDLTHVEAMGPHKLNLGIRFLPINSQVDLLKKGVLAIAMEKLQTPTSTLPTGEPSGDSDLVVSDAHHPHDAAQAGKPAGEHIHHHKNPPLSDILVDRGRLTKAAAHAAHKEATATNTSITRFLIKNRSVKPLDLCQALAIQSGLPTTRLEGVDVPLALRKVFSFLTMQRYEIVPFSESREMMCIAAAHPLTDMARMELEKLAKRNLLVFLAPIDQIQDLQFRIRPRGPNQERRHARVKIAVHADYQFCDEHGVNLDETVREGIVENMSDGGFLIVGPVETAHSANELVRQGSCLRIGFLCGERSIHAICKIRHIEPAPAVPEGGQKQWHFGLEIAQVEPEDLNQLKDACARSTMDQMKKRSRGFNPDEQ